MQRILSVVLLASLLVIAGCQSMSYYAQSVKGQWQVIHRSKSIDNWLNDEDVTAELKQKLEQVKEIRRFASRQLHLPNNKSYTQYADLERSYVVWNIFAARELSLEPYLWCYPVIGCQAYRGYFSKPPAIDLAEELRSTGYDISVNGVKAYSTLGWFNDPVLNTFINYSEINLASLIFHELSHQVVYVKGDTAFNESFATMVENKGIEAWLKDNDKDVELSEYKQTQVFENSVIDLITQYKERLDKVYKTLTTDQDKRQQKEKIVMELKVEYQKSKQRVEFKSGWDNWFAQGLNNAHLVAIGTYYDKVGEFKNLFESVNQDFMQFFIEVKKLAKLNKDDRDKFLASLNNS